MSYIEEGPYVSAPIFVLSQFPSLSIQILARLTTTKNNCFFYILPTNPPPPPLKNYLTRIKIKPNMLLHANIVKIPQYIFITYQSLRTIQLCYPFNVFFAEIRKPAFIGDKVYHVIQISRCNFLFSFDG